MRFVLFISIVQSVLFLGHWFFYRTLVRFLGVADPTKLLALKAVLGLFSVSLVLTSILAFRYSNLLMRCLYTAAASWLGILYLFILGSILCWIFYGSARLLHLPLDRRILLEIFLGIALLAGFYGFINAEMTRITRIGVQLPLLPGPWKGKTAVWISDTHLGQVRGHGFAGRVAAKVRDLRPDIVFIGGDLYDGAAVDLDKAIEPFSRISAPYGTYFVTGNHEEFSDNIPYLQAVRRAGIRVLDNEKVELDGLQIIGVDYRASRREEDFKKILQEIGVDPLRPSILLKHAPLHLHVAMEQRISLQLSGHSHRGQVLFFRWITSRVYRGYDYGLKRFGDLLVTLPAEREPGGPPCGLIRSRKSWSSRSDEIRDRGLHWSPPVAPPSVPCPLVNQSIGELLFGDRGCFGPRSG